MILYTAMQLYPMHTYMGLGWPRPGEQNQGSGRAGSRIRASRIKDQGDQDQGPKRSKSRIKEIIIKANRIKDQGSSMKLTGSRKEKTRNILQTL